MALTVARTEDGETELVDQAWEKHSHDHFRAPTAHDMEILIKTCLMPLALETQNDRFTFVHELKQEMHVDLKYVGSLEKEIDELESNKAEFSNMYDILLQECVSNDVMCSYLHSLSDLDAHTQLQCLYQHKIKECECLAEKLSKQTETVSKEVYNELLRSFAKLENHSISLEVTLQHAVQMKKTQFAMKKCSTVFLKNKKDAQSHKTTKRYMPVEKKSDSKKRDRQIPVGLKWIPIRKSVETCYNTNDSASPLGKETHNPKTVICANSSSLSAGSLEDIPRRVPFDQRNNPPQNPRIVYPILDINYFCHFLVTIENLYPMHDEPMWVADGVVALTLGSAITICETANEFAIKGNAPKLPWSQSSQRQYYKNPFIMVLVEITQEDQNAVARINIFLLKKHQIKLITSKDKVILKLDWAKTQKTKSSLKKTVAFAAEGSSNTDTDKIMARMDAMTIKMDAQYKELQSRAKNQHPTLTKMTAVSRKE
ncbi:hypothetical protein Tco_0265856 [Tanacetum coccineum]